MKRWQEVGIVLACGLLAVVTPEKPVTLEMGSCSDWGCEMKGDGLCCAALRQPGLPGLEQPVCLACRQRPRRCRPLAAHPVPYSRLPSVRLYLRLHGLMEQTSILTCAGYACNRPLQLATPPAAVPHSCWHHSPLNPFFPGHLGDYKPVLVACPPLLHCCTTALLPGGLRWGLGCAVCPLVIDAHAPPAPVNDTAESSPWTQQTLLCPLSDRFVRPGYVPVHYQNLFNGTRKHNYTYYPTPTTNFIHYQTPTTNLIHYQTTSVPTSFSRHRIPVRPASNASESMQGDWEVCSRAMGCQDRSKCCVSVGGAAHNEEQLHFCLPCALLPDYRNGSAPICGPLREWQELSGQSLRQYMPSVYNFLRTHSQVAARVRLCRGAGCNRPRSFARPRRRLLKGHWCWHWSPLARFFRGNANGSSAVAERCPGGLACCSFYRDPETSWAIGCAVCGAGKESWPAGEITPWQEDSEVCAWPPKALSAPTETGALGQSLCRAEGVEPHLSWRCPPETACCLTAGHLDRPWLPRLPACLPCGLLQQALRPNVPLAEPLCASLDHWQERTLGAVHEYLPSLEAFLRKHEWVLKNARVTTCQGDGCNVPKGYSIPSLDRSGVWCWHHSPMDKFFDEDVAGDGSKAVLAKCKDGQECCGSLVLASGDKWALGCHKCGLPPPPMGVPAAETLAAEAPSPWSSAGAELCAWNPLHRCQLLVEGEASPYGDRYETACPSTHCCYTLLLGPVGVAKGCAPCLFPGSCVAWNPRLRIAGHELFWPKPRLAEPSLLCLCAGQLCNELDRVPPAARSPPLSPANLTSPTDAFLTAEHQRRIQGAMDVAVGRMARLEAHLKEKGHPALAPDGNRVLIPHSGHPVLATESGLTPLASAAALQSLSFALLLFAFLITDLG